jgi:hypothetical protein
MTLIDDFVEQNSEVGEKMFSVMIDDEKTLLISDATTVKVNDDKGYVSFYDGYGNLVSLFRLCEIKGFYQMV